MDSVGPCGGHLRARNRAFLQMRAPSRRADAAEKTSRSSREATHEILRSQIDAKSRYRQKIRDFYTKKSPGLSAADRHNEKTSIRL